MTMTLKAIADILDRWNIGYYADPTETYLRLETKSQHIEDLPVYLRAVQNGQIISINAPALFNVNEKVFKDIFLGKLLELHNSISLINFYLNTYQNGEEWVGASIEMPLFERQLAHMNLFYCMAHLTYHLKVIIPRFQHILDTGREPKKLLDDN